MSQPKPKRILVEFDDGSKTETSFELLPGPLQSEIMRQPFASKSNPAPEKDRFVLLEWDDGWKEVLQVNASCAEINRYYVISRTEHVGRLSLNDQQGYPELIEIVRKPLNLKKITFKDTFQLTLERSDREGQKTDHFFALAKDENSYPDIMETLKKIIEEEGIDPEVLKSQGPDALSEQYEKITQKIGVKAGFRQQDLLDFISCLAKSAP